MIEKKEYFKDWYAKIDLTKKRLAELKDYEKNNKIHPEIQKETLKEIIEEVWYDVPIIIDKHDVIVAWHCRKEVLTLLWAEYVDVIVKDKLSEKQIRKYRLLDNKIAELAEDHTENIHFELEELEDPKLNELYGFEIETLNPDKEAIEDDVPEVSDNIIVEKWDIFQLWEHRLMCWDSTSIDDVEKLMDWEKADLILTDPPYQWKMWRWWFKNNPRMQKNKDALMDSIEHIYDFDPTDTFPILEIVKKKQCNIFLFCNKNLVPDYLNYCIENNRLFDILTWHKPSCIPANNNTYYPDTEYLIKIKDKWATFNTGLLWENVSYNKYWLLDARSEWKDINHPTVKPIEILKDCIYVCSNKSDWILDLFWGSWSTLIASEKTNRKCYMMELDPKYITVILQRYYKYTDGQKEIKCLNREIENFNSIFE